MSKGAFFSAYLRRSPYDLRRWPRIAFDYRFPTPGCNLNLVTLVAGGMKIVAWAGRNEGYKVFINNQVGKIEGIQDGQWQHADFDFLKMVEDAGTKATDLQVGYIGTWATSAPGGMYRNPPHATFEIDNLTFYDPRDRDVTFDWTPRRPGAFDTYSFALDQKTETEPPTTAPSAEGKKPSTHKSYTGLSPGRWHFHLRARRPDGQWTPAVHRTIEVVP